VNFHAASDNLIKDAENGSFKRSRRKTTTNMKTLAKKQKFPLHPKHPERICWGCDKYCPANNLMCSNGSGRTEHPCEFLGEDWYTFGGWAEEFDDRPDPSESA
jgi:RNase P subunit RPR2